VDHFPSGEWITFRAARPGIAMPTEQNQIEAIGGQLRAKISSKFTASTFLAGFALAVLSTQISTLWQASNLPVLLPVAMSFVVGSFVLFVAAIIRLDELTMPKRFWPEGATAVALPVPLGGSYLTDNDLWELHNRMIFYWYRCTLVATVATAVGIVAMLVPLSTAALSTVRGWTFASTLAGLLIAFGHLEWVRRHAKQKFNPLIRPLD
jgi:small basic protein